MLGIWLLFGVVVVALLAQAALYVSAAVEMHRIRLRDRHKLWERMLTSPLAPRVTVLVPAYNESLSIVGAVRNLLSLSYPNLEVVVVNDGSDDDTLEALVGAFYLSAVPVVYQRVIDTSEVTALYRSREYPNLVVADKRNGGKSDALNAALNLATGELVCAIDADTVVAREALQQLVVPFLASRSTVAVGGTVRLLNDAEWANGEVARTHAPRRVLVGAQAAEYTRSFLVGRVGWNPLGGNLIISGAFGIFRRSSLLDVRGYEGGSIGEDMELIVRLRRLAAERGEHAEVVFTPDPVAYTEAPESLRTLARQRNRWFRGLLDVLVRHRRLIFNPRYGTAGMLAMPYFVVVETVAPVIEALGLVYIVVALSAGWIDVGGLAPLVLAFAAGICVSFLVLLIDDVYFRSYTSTTDRVRMVGHVVFEQVVFRPLTLWWRMWGLVHFLQGRSEWGAQTRRGLPA